MMVLSIFFYSKTYPNHKIFLLFDAPHMIKSVRNNWINLRNMDKEFYFPQFDQSFGTKASFKHLINVHNEEAGNSHKMSHKLNSSVLYPSSIERQKVHLALKVFDETTIAALWFSSPNYEYTCKFLLV